MTTSDPEYNSNDDSSILFIDIQNNDKEKKIVSTLKKHSDNTQKEQSNEKLDSSSNFK